MAQRMIQGIYLRIPINGWDPLDFSIKFGMFSFRENEHKLTGRRLTQKMKQIFLWVRWHLSYGHNYRQRQRIFRQYTSYAFTPECKCLCFITIITIITLQGANGFEHKHTQVCLYWRLMSVHGEPIKIYLFVYFICLVLSKLCVNVCLLNTARFWPVNTLSDYSVKHGKQAFVCDKRKHLHYFKQYFSCEIKRCDWLPCDFGHLTQTESYIADSVLRAFDLILWLAKCLKT